jgi:uncharacterized membrane protein
MICFLLIAFGFTIIAAGVQDHNSQAIWAGVVVMGLGAVLAAKGDDD